MQVFSLLFLRKPLITSVLFFLLLKTKKAPRLRGFYHIMSWPLFDVTDKAYISVSNQLFIRECDGKQE